jgi:tetratricopeptide (TPR) repeat protein
MTRIVALLMWMLAPALAQAQPADALAAFDRGAFAEAAQLARAGTDAPSRALAARATLAMAAYQTTDKRQALSLVAQALADGKAAMAADPKHIEALLQTAIAYGYRAKLTRSPGDAKTARRLIEQGLALAPANPFALAALGGWHGETVAELGGFLAGTMVGARKDEAIRRFEAALKVDPASPSFPTFYATTLAQTDFRRNQPRVAALFATAANLKPRDGFEALMQRHAAEISAALASGRVQQARSLIDRYAAFGTL